MNALIMIMIMVLLSNGAPVPSVRDKQPSQGKYIMTWGTEKFKLEIKEKTYVYQRISNVVGNADYVPVSGEWCWDKDTRIFSMIEYDSSLRMVRWNIFLDEKLKGKLISVVDDKGVDSSGNYVGVTLKKETNE